MQILRSKVSGISLINHTNFRIGAGESCDGDLPEISCATVAKQRNTIFVNVAIRSMLASEARPAVSLLNPKSSKAVVKRIAVADSSRILPSPSTDIPRSLQHKFDQKC